ncbi:MAG TPA: DUF1552 domain-containing protein [Terriglobia bacterium]|nr:DUF1552 domain-containing protein [Terriglobia bacterium]
MRPYRTVRSTMFISRKHLSRRTFLRGAGVAIGLPFLDAMVPAGTALAQTAAKPIPHMGFIYFPHGAIMDQWTPAKEGADFELSPILKPFAPFKKQLTVVSALDNKPAVSPAVHAITPGTWLSCVHPRESQDPYGAVTVDQIAAKHIGQDTPLPSLEVATEGGGGNGGACDRNFGCSYAGTISFRTPSTPLPMEYNPRKLFERVFGQGDSPKERKAIARQYASILDLVVEEASDLQRSLDSQDRAMLNDYLESVREIERRVQKMEERDLSKLNLPNVPPGTPSFDERLNLMFDMVSLAYQANLTRIFTMMMAAEASNQTYNHIGIPDAFHPVSHHQNDPKRLATLVKIQTYHTEVFTKFLTKLQKMPDGDGSMLDHSIIVFGSNMSNSNLHNHDPLPTAVVSGWSKIKGGQHLRYPDHTPLANLFLTLLDRAGIAAESFGDSTGKLSEV